MKAIKDVIITLCMFGLVAIGVVSCVSSDTFRRTVCVK
jgi:hypothetical protein